MAEGRETAMVRLVNEIAELEPEKTPLTSFHGTWTKNRGTGRYLGIKGAGTYQGRFTSPTAYVVEWRGEITVPKDRVAKR